MELHGRAGGPEEFAFIKQNTFSSKWDFWEPLQNWHLSRKGESVQGHHTSSTRASCHEGSLCRELPRGTVSQMLSNGTQKIPSEEALSWLRFNHEHSMLLSWQPWRNTWKNSSIPVINQEFWIYNRGRFGLMSEACKWTTEQTKKQIPRYHFIGFYMCSLGKNWDYISACYSRTVSHGEYFYIALQGPLPDTADDA